MIFLLLTLILQTISTQSCKHPSFSFTTYTANSPITSPVSCDFSLPDHTVANRGEDVYIFTWSEIDQYNEVRVHGQFSYIGQPGNISNTSLMYEEGFDGEGYLYIMHDIVFFDDDVLLLFILGESAIEYSAIEVDYGGGEFGVYYNTLIEIEPLEEILMTRVNPEVDNRVVCGYIIGGSTNNIILMLFSGYNYVDEFAFDYTENTNTYHIESIGNDTFIMLYLNTDNDELIADRYYVTPNDEIISLDDSYIVDTHPSITRFNILKLSNDSYVIVWVTSRETIHYTIFYHNGDIKYDNITTYSSDLISSKLDMDLLSEDVFIITYIRNSEAFAMICNYKDPSNVWQYDFFVVDPVSNSDPLVAALSDTNFIISWNDDIHCRYEGRAYFTTCMCPDTYFDYDTDCEICSYPFDEGYINVTEVNTYETECRKCNDSDLLDPRPGTDCGECVDTYLNPDTLCLECFDSDLLDPRPVTSDCKHCINRKFDPSTLCTTCNESIYDYQYSCNECKESTLLDPSSECQYCKNMKHDRSTTCTECLDLNYDYESGCTECSVAKADLKTNCTTCIDDYYDINEDCDILKTEIVQLFAIVGFSIICVVVFLVLGVWLLFVVLKNRKLSKSKVFDLTKEELEYLKIEKAADGDKLDVKDINIDNSLLRIDPDAIKLVEIIGEGGSNSTVYLAKWKNTQVAYKVYKIIFSMSNDFEGFEVFQQEINIMSKISHPSILQFYGFSLNKSRIGIIMEFCSNGDLRKYLSLNEMTFDQICTILKLIASGMSYLHQRNIIHRDLKCENILLNDANEPKIMDFGLSRFDDTNSKTVRVGTNRYIAPEVMLGRNYGPKIDVFSFGIMMYATMTKNFLIYDENNGDRIEFMVATNEKYRPIIKEDMFSEEQEWFKELMISCWNHLPEERPNFKDINTLFYEKDY